MVCDSHLEPRLHHVHALLQALAEARHAVTKARARLAAAVSAERATHDGLFELEKDRFVVPVKSATPPKALGRKRGASRSGRSSYVEPHGCAAAADAVEAALSALETAETQRLAELTAQLAKTADPLRTALEAVAALDAAVMVRTLHPSIHLRLCVGA